MSSPKEFAAQLCVLAKEKGVRFPKIWDEAKLMQSCGAVLMTHRNGANFDVDAALESLIEKYGIEEAKVAPNKKRKETSTTDDSEESQKKVKKTAVIACEENRDIADAIMDVAKEYFKQKDMRKGGVFSKAAKAIRECETQITTLKEAMALKGVGKSIAGMIVEKLETGEVKKLEELRAGSA